MRGVFRVAHKYLALCVASLWVLQALSGILLVFHRSIDDRLLGASAQPANLKVIDGALAAIAQRTPGTKIVEYFPSGGVEGQVDVMVDRNGGAREVVRIDGATGTTLRTSAWEDPWPRLTVFRFVFLLHKQLLAGKPGDWFIGVSGGLLFVNILLGLRLAWPAAKRWSATLLPRRIRTGPMAFFFGWHRAIGLWLAPFGLIIALTGVLMVWSPDLQRVLGADFAPPSATRPLGPNETIISASAATTAALGVYDGATIAVVSMPDARHPWYKIRLRRPGELRRVYGTTQVYVDAKTGEVLKSRDATTASLQSRFIAALYPIHDGEWGGVATRLFAIVVGLWLVATIVLGLTLWWTRRGARERKQRAAQFELESISS